MSNALLATLPPSLTVLNASSSHALTAAASFAHLTSLSTLTLRHTRIGNATLATLPPSLLTLDVSCCTKLTAAATLPNLPLLRVLCVSSTNVGDALIATVPPDLVELHATNCSRVTRAATLDHLAGLRVLQSSRTDFSHAALAACRARGCTAPADGALGHEDMDAVRALALLPDGRLVCGCGDGAVRVWDTEERSGGVEVVIHVGAGAVHALALLPDGRQVAVGVASVCGTRGGIVVWDVGGAGGLGPMMDCDDCVERLVVGLPNGHLIALYHDTSLWDVDADAGVVLPLEMPLECGPSTTAVAVLPDGRLATCADDSMFTVTLWDAATQHCTASLTGHAGCVFAIVSLADGRLASGSEDGTVRLWDASNGACVGVLSGEDDDNDPVVALAALPDGRLAAAASNGRDLRVWDTRCRPACAPPPLVLDGHSKGGLLDTLESSVALQPLPGGRLATATELDSRVRLWRLTP